MPYHNLKNQSAMEYLMTYGWAIIIVAIVLGALFQLGFFNGTSMVPQGCIARSGYYCSNPVLSTTGVLTLTVGQATGTQMNNTILYFVPSGSSFSHAASVNTGTLSMGQTTTVSMPLPTGSPYPSSYALGTQISGTLYLGYVQSGQVLNSRFGTISIKVTGASGAVLQQQPNSIPSGISTYVPITLSNSQSSATPAPFQQMVQFSESTYSNYITYNGNAANFEFFDQNGQVIPSWIESNNSGTITAWLKLPNGITASNSIEVYLGFAPKGTNLLSSSGTTGIGEAPQLSSTYAQYDDGASVFLAYVNGDTPTSDFNVASGITLSQTTGVIYGSSTINVLNISGYDTTGQPVAIFKNVALPNIPLVLESNFMHLSSGVGGLGASNGEGTLTDMETTGTTSNSIDVEMGWSGNYFSQAYLISGVITTDQNQAGNANANWNYGLVIYYGSSATSWYGSIAPQLYSTAGGYSGILNNNPLNSASNIYLAIGLVYTNPTDDYHSYYNWLRIRAYPPSGVMPSVSFGGVS